jgi:hypothetical protein
MMDGSVRSGEAMTSITPNLAANAIGHADARDSAAANAADSGPFVLNLTSSTTPMALAHPELAELKRFTFFVSRRFEEGRERFRLHMGYFTTQAEAEEWLAVVREIYPGAWAGEAPGKKLRARAAAAAAEQAQHAVGPMPRPSVPNTPPPAQAAPVVRAAAARPAPQQRPAPPVAVPVARPAVTERSARESQAGISTTFEAPATAVPTVHAAAAPPVAPPVISPPVLTPPVAKAAPVQPFVSAAKNAPVAVPVPVARAAPVVSAARAPSLPASGGDSLAGRSVTTGRPPSITAVPPVVPKAAAAAAPVSAGSPARAPVAAPARPAVTKAAPPPAAHASKQRPGQKPPKGNAFNDSNVREVLAALDDTGETGQTRMMPAPQLPLVDGSYESSLTDTQVLRYLETRREGESGARADDQQETSISLLKPDDTGTRRALKEAVTQNAPVSFAVQLQWSVQPVELDKVPPLAIFSAYTLYTVEGSRDGRKWYGLRLGFFSDAISAKQVAYYVRSEFASVAVVPVSPQEKGRASEEDNKKAASPTFPRKTRQAPVDEFKLIDSDTPAAPVPAAKAAPKPAVTAARTAPQAASAKRTPAAAVGKASGGRVGARERRGPQTLEETLEILGAGELEVDSGRETMNDAGVRHLRVEVQKNTPFSRLLERLSERTKKN